MTQNRLYDDLLHMQQAAADACGFVAGMDRDGFQRDKRTQQAVIMSLIMQAGLRPHPRCKTQDLTPTHKESRRLQR